VIVVRDRGVSNVFPYLEDVLSWNRGDSLLFVHRRIVRGQSFLSLVFRDWGSRGRLLGGPRDDRIGKGLAFLDIRMFDVELDRRGWGLCTRNVSMFVGCGIRCRGELLIEECFRGNCREGNASDHSIRESFS